LKRAIAFFADRLARRGAENQSGESMSTFSLNIERSRRSALPALSALHLQHALVFAAACSAVVLFALVPATTRMAAAQLDGLSIGLIRATGAGLASLPLLFVVRARAPQSRIDWVLLLVYALGNFAAFPALFSLGTHKTSGTHAALIMAAMPVLAGLIAMVLDRRLPRSGWFIGAAIALAGEATLVGMGRGAHSTGATLAGDAIVLVSCMLSAVSIVAGARLSARMNPLAATLWAITIGSIALAPLSLARMAAAPYAYQQLTGTTWMALLQITLGAAVTANILWLWAVSRGGLVRIAPIQFAQPVCALFFASVLLDERVTAPLLLAAAGIVFGTITACRAARPRAAKEPSSRPHAVPGRERNAPAVALANLPFHRAPGLAPAVAPAAADAAERPH
jgi:drug/metabolite transporter (DMT)-like permease